MSEDDIARRTGVTREVWDLSQILAEHLWVGEYVSGIGDTGDYIIDPRTLAQIVLNAGYTPPTPPADDVREALIGGIARDEQDWRFGDFEETSNHSPSLAEYIADGILANLLIEVRPRGTVTDAEVERAMSVFLKHPGKGTAAAMRAALEAAAKA